MNVGSLFAGGVAEVTRVDELEQRIEELEEEKRKLIGALENEKARKRKARADHARLRDIVEAVQDELTDGLQCSDWPATTGGKDE